MGERIDKMVDRTNGCGPYWLGEWVPDGPDGVYRCPCDDHDLRYEIGGSEINRWHADAKFFGAMLRRSRLLPWYKKPLGWACAVLYFLLVLLFGWRSFSYWR